MSCTGNNRRIFANTSYSSVFSCNGILLFTEFSETARLVYQHRFIQKTFAVICREKGNAAENETDDYCYSDTAYGVRLLYDGKKRNLDSVCDYCCCVGMPSCLFHFWRQDIKKRVKSDLSIANIVNRSNIF